MSVESFDYSNNTQSTHQTNENLHSKAPPPPPPFSAQRKRPPLSNLGIEVSLASDVKTPNTPTPQYSNDHLDSSEAVLKIRSSSSISDQTNNYQNQQQYTHHNPSFDHMNIQKQPFAGSLKEPRIAQIIDLLADFDSAYCLKSQRLDNLEDQVNKSRELLHDKDNELKALARERLENLEQLRRNHVKLKELEGKALEISKYDGFVKAKITELESLMTQISTSKEAFKTKESEFKEGLEAKEKSLQSAITTIQELRLEKELLQTKIEALNNENKDNCTEFNGRIYELNQELSKNVHLIEKIESEKELLKSDLKNISGDRDRIQRECSKALKEITELAVSEDFTGYCESKDLGNLESSVLWIKKLCEKLNNELDSKNLEWLNLKQEMEDLKNENSTQSKTKNALFEELKALKEYISNYENSIESLKNELDSANRSKTILNNLKTKIGLKDVEEDDFNLIETLTKSIKLTSEIEDLKQLHEKALKELKEEFGRLLREESSRWKAQKEALESEISKLSRTDNNNNSSNNSTDNNNLKNEYAGLKVKSQQPDLTAIIRDLKETSSLLGKSKPSSQRKRSAQPTEITSKRRSVTSSLRNNSSNSQRISSPSSVNSNDIWNLFK